MNLQQTTTILKYIAIGLAVVTLGALAGWYFYLRQQGISLSDLAGGRGLSEIAPSFNAPGGSTYQNIVSGVSNVADKVAGFVQGNDSTPLANKLWRVDRTPIAGMGFTASAGTSTKITYAQQATGHIFTADPATHALDRLSNVLVPKTYRALFAYDGSFIMQTVGEDGAVRSIAGTPSASTTEATSTSASLGRELPRNLRSLTLDPMKRTLLWLAADAKDGMVIASVPWGSTTGTKLISTPIGSWRLYATPEGGWYAALSGEDDLPGYAYRIDAKGALTPLVRDVPGLSFLPSGDPAVFLYSSSAGGALSLYAKTSASSTPAQLPVGTVADKCVWAPGKAQIAYCAVPVKAPKGPFLGPWYRGLTHTTDAWWEIDAANGTAHEIYSLQKADDENIDVVRPMIDPTGNYIAFLDGEDQSLWLLRIH